MLNGTLLIAHLDDLDLNNLDDLDDLDDQQCTIYT